MKSPPRAKEVKTLIGVCLQATDLGRVDVGRQSEAELPNRPEAIPRIHARALAACAEPSVESRTGNPFLSELRMKITEYALMDGEDESVPWIEMSKALVALPDLELEKLALKAVGGIFSDFAANRKRPKTTRPKRSR
jgi:hypothetical protein